MPKRIKFFFLLTIALFALLMAVSCGTGDKMGGETTSPVDLVSGNSTGGTGGVIGGGGGGGGGGAACVLSLYNVCQMGATQTICSAETGAWTAGTCSSLGYNTLVGTVSVGGYTITEYTMP